MRTIIQASRWQRAAHLAILLNALGHSVENVLLWVNPATSNSVTAADVCPQDQGNFDLKNAGFMSSWPGLFS